MDISSALIVFGLIGALILPFIINSQIKKNKEAKFLKHLLALSEKEKMTISQKELWGKHAIAIDTNSKKVIYLNKKNSDEEETIIDLADVEKCRVVETDLSVSRHSGNNVPANRLDLVLTFKKSNIPEKALEFYNNPAFMPTSEDFSFIENWQRIINSNLKNNN